MVNFHLNLQSFCVNYGVSIALLTSSSTIDSFMTYRLHRLHIRPNVSPSHRLFTSHCASRRRNEQKNDINKSHPEIPTPADAQPNSFSKPFYPSHEMAPAVLPRCPDALEFEL